MSDADELLEIAAKLEEAAKAAEKPKFREPVAKLKKAATSIGNSFCGSWLGYHANVYYEDFHEPPPGAIFSQEWGLMDTYGSSFGSRGDWVQVSDDDVVIEINKRAGSPDIGPAEEATARLNSVFEDCKAEIISILTSNLGKKSDDFLAGAKKAAIELEHLSSFEVVQRLQPSGKIITRDMNALGQGSQQPPHIKVLSRCLAVENSIGVANNLSKLARQAASHISRSRQHQQETVPTGKTIFIGHGRSAAWRDLKDFVHERLSLPWDEFNRVPVAGFTNIHRLSQMLDSAAIAFLVMTAEDEHSDGKAHARENVVHEAGLFQGRLGFTRAIILLEDGCTEFSNIQGLGQIRFPKGNIKAVFEDVRAVLEREGIVRSSR